MLFFVCIIMFASFQLANKNSIVNEYLLLNVSRHHLPPAPHHPHPTHCPRRDPQIHALLYQNLRQIDDIKTKIHRL